MLDGARRFKSGDVVVVTDRILESGIRYYRELVGYLGEVVKEDVMSEDYCWLVRVYDIEMSEAYNCLMLAEIGFRAEELEVIDSLDNLTEVNFSNWTNP